MQISFVFGNYAYIGFTSSPGKIIKVDLTTFTEVGSIVTDAATIGVDLMGFAAATADGGYGYFGSYDDPATVINDLATLNVEETVTLANGTAASSITLYGGHAYVGTYSGHIAKIQLSDMSLVVTKRPVVDDAVSYAYVIGSTIYFATQGQYDYAYLIKYSTEDDTFETYQTNH